MPIIITWVCDHCTSRDTQSFAVDEYFNYNDKYHDNYHSCGSITNHSRLLLCTHCHDKWWKDVVDNSPSDTVWTG